jgi:NTE family protein
LRWQWDFINIKKEEFTPMTRTENESLSFPGLVLSGGGARGAYQAGVIRAIFEIAQQYEIKDIFSILSGVSAGAINASYMASHLSDPDVATSSLCRLWQNLKADDVFSTRYSSIARNASRLIKGLSFGGLSPSLATESISLLDTAPLRELLQHSIPFGQIQQNIEAKRLHAVSLTATDYTTSLGITFVQGDPSIPMWHRARRHSVRADLTLDHVMASSAIPIFFPPYKVEGREYGDGCLRNQAPLSPPIHLGAHHLLVVGVRTSKRVHIKNTQPMTATLGRVASVLVNAIFMDAVESDLERLHFINQALGRNADPDGPAGIRPVLPFYLRPSQDLSEIAFKHQHRLPKVIRYLMGGLGSPEETSDLLSYLLFDPHYCSELVDLGYEDTKKRGPEMALFFGKTP